MYFWTPVVSARARLAEALQKHPDRVQPQGLLATDLEAIAHHGRAAEAADRQQRAQLADSSAAVTLKRSTLDEVLARETALRNRAPAVVKDLEEHQQPGAALFLARASYARFRIRELAETPAGGGNDADSATLKRLERVAREDMVTRMDGLAAFCTALLVEGREPIANAFAARGIDRPALEKLAADAKALAESGRNVMSPAEATRRESDAVFAQRAKWHAVRRMLRSAVRGSAELEKIWAEC